MQAFKRYLIKKYGHFVMAWDTDSGSGKTVLPAQIPITGDTNGKWQGHDRHTVRAIHASHLEEAAVAREVRKLGGAYEWVVDAYCSIDRARMVRLHDFTRMLPSATSRAPKTTTNRMTPARYDFLQGVNLQTPTYTRRNYGWREQRAWCEYMGYIRWSTETERYLITPEGVAALEAHAKRMMGEK